MNAGSIGAKRRRLGVRQDELADALGIDYRALKPIEDEKIGIDTETFRRIDAMIDELADAKREAVTA